MSINKKIVCLAVALGVSSVVVLTGCNSSPADLVSPTEESASTTGPFPPELKEQGFEYSSGLTALDCNPDKINKDQKSTCKGKTDKYYEAERQDSKGKWWKVKYKGVSAKLMPMKNTTYSIVSQQLKIGAPCKVVVKGDKDNTWVGQNGYWNSPVIVDVTMKADSWKKMK